MASTIILLEPLFSAFGIVERVMLSWFVVKQRRIVDTNDGNHLCSNVGSISFAVGINDVFLRPFAADVVRRS